MFKKNISSLLAVSAVLIVVSFFWYEYSHRTSPVSTWTHYQDVKLGFAFDYPTDKMTNEGSIKEPNGVTFWSLGVGSLPPAMSVEVNGDYNVATDTPNIDTWTDLDGKRNIIETTIIAGRKALVVGEVNNFIFTYHGRIYQLFFSGALSPVDIEHIKQSLKLFETKHY